MSTILFWLAAVILGVVILSMIPGLELLMKPILKLFFDALVVIIQGSGSWLLWIAKKIVRAHSGLLRHLLVSAEQIDPAYALEQKNKST